MKRIKIVAMREFRQTVLTKAFFIGSVVVPVLLVLVSLGASIFLKPHIPPLSGTLSVIDGSDAFLEHLNNQLHPELERSTPMLSTQGASAEEVIEDVLAQSEAIQSTQQRPDTSGLQIKSGTEDDIDAIKESMRDGDAAGLIIVGPGTLDPKSPERGRITLWIKPNAPPSHLDLIKKASGRAAVDTRLQSLNLKPDAIRSAMKTPRTSAMRLGKQGGEKRESEVGRMLIPMGFMMLLWIVAFTGGNYLMMSTIEEKSTRAMEVLLSAVSPTELLAGKILGFATVSAVMLGMYIAVAVAFMIIFAAVDLVTWQDMLLSGLFFVLAYLMVAAIMAGIGSAVSDITEAQSLMGPAMVILILPMLLMPVITEDPNGMVGTIASYIPPVSPFVMVLRIAASPEPLPLFELLLASIWSMACAAGMIWAAGRVFRVGVLMQGKPPSPVELIRWIRYR